MKLKALDWLVCPVCGGEFEIEDAKGHPPRPSEEVSRPLSCARCHAPKPERSTHSPAVCCSVCYAVEIESGRLVCTGGHAFEIREGVPRLRLDQKLDALHAPAQGDSLTVAASFSAEWSHFNYERDRTWHQGVQERCELFLKEVALPREELRGKVVLDAGCGNGSLSRGLNQFGCEVLAVDVSDSVIVAHRHFAAKGNDRTHFVQADLLNPPLQPGVFDVIFSSGVLHHNPSTRDALRSIAQSLAPGGRIYIWVYGHVPGLAHKLKEVVRRTVSPLPSTVKQAIVALWLPQAMLRQYLRTMLGRSTPQDRLKGRERFVLLLDHYTPRYRWEHTPEEVHGWYRELGYTDIATTEQRAWGFGCAATRPTDAVERRTDPIRACTPRCDRQ